MDSIDVQILNKEVRLSYSSLKNFLISPEHFIQYKNQPFLDTDATIFGNAFHCYVLRNQDFEKEYMIFDDSKRPSPDQTFAAKINKEWKSELLIQAELEEKILVSQEDFDKIREMTDKLYFHEPSRNILEYSKDRCEYEKEVNYTRKKLKFKSFIDIRADIFLADLKTTNDAEPKSFQRDIYKYAYDLQSIVYNDADCGGKCTYNKLKEFYFIAIEKTAPYGVSVHRMSEEALNQAFEEYLMALDNFNKCLENPDEFLRTYDFYCNDQTNKFFDVNVPFWKKQ